MSDKALYAGVARADITPPVGLPLLHPLRETVATSVEAPLTATALVVSDGAQLTAIIACDLIYVRGEFADRLRARVAERIETSTDRVLINCSHTHAVVPMPGWESPNRPANEPLRRYYAYLEEALAGVAYAALQRLAPARMAAGRGRVRIGVNRRERLPDGRIILGENPDKPVDEDVTVLRFDHLDGSPLALVMNYACHPDVLGPRVDFISPDYVGHARAAAEALSGVPSLFLQGTAADIDPITSIVLGPDGRDEIRRLGVQLGAEAAKVFADLRTARRRAEREIAASMSDGLAMWRYGDVTGPTLTGFGAITRRLTLPLRPFPPLEEVRAELAALGARLEAARAAGAPRAEVQLIQRQIDWAQLQEQAIVAGQRPEIELELQALRINDVGVLAIPGEPFVEIGLRVKARSPFAQTLVLGYSNGCVVYIPTAAAFEEGGYEVNAHRNYMLPSGVTPEWASTIEEVGVAMLNELAAAGEVAP